jgi:hypothetical protein
LPRPPSTLTQKLWARFSKLEERQIDREWEGKYKSRADYLRHIIINRPVVTQEETDAVPEDKG